MSCHLFSWTDGQGPKDSAMNAMHPCTTFKIHFMAVNDSQQYRIFTFDRGRNK